MVQLKVPLHILKFPFCLEGNNKEIETGKD